MKLSELLRLTVENNATDLYLIPQSPPMMRIKDEIVPVVEMPLSRHEIEQVAAACQDVPHVLLLLFVEFAESLVMKYF